MLYFIRRRSDKMWWDGDGWSATVAKAMSAAQAGIVLAGLPGGMDEGVYKLVLKREE